MSPFESKLAKAHAWTVSQPLLHDFTWGVRILLAIGFIPPGMIKVLGRRFTLIPPENPIGAIFEAFFQTGFYWNFLGACQVLAGLLLLVPATATLGAALFLPILVNIFVLTVSVGFKGTPYVVGAMLLANVYLVCWDGDRFRHLLPGLGVGEWPGTVRRAQTSGVLRLTWWAAAIGGLAVLLAIRGLASSDVVLPGLALPFVGLGLDLLRLRRRHARA
ncbi:MAG: hypothetical protein AAGA81_20035 [Acidobacteriota bacterium]